VGGGGAKCVERFLQPQAGQGEYPQTGAVKASSTSAAGSAHRAMKRGSILFGGEGVNGQGPGPVAGCCQCQGTVAHPGGAHSGRDGCAALVAAVAAPLAAMCPMSRSERLRSRRPYWVAVMVQVEHILSILNSGYRLEWNEAYGSPARTNLSNARSAYAAAAFVSAAVAQPDGVALGLTAPWAHAPGRR
jgi:hypothetical protein